MGNTIPISFFDNSKYLYKPVFEGEKWIWLEIYPDNKKKYIIIPQFFKNENGELIRRSFKDINQSNLIEFQMMNKNGNVFRFNISKEDNFRLIHFYRNIQTFEMSSGKILQTIRYPIQGYQKTINGKNIKVLIKFYPDGSFEVSDMD